MSTYQDENEIKPTSKTFDGEENVILDSVKQSDEKKEQENAGYDSEGSKSEEDEEDAEYDTDIEVDMEKTENVFDPTGRTIYLETCSELKIVPVTNFLSGLTTSKCDLAHHSVGAQGIQAIARALIQNIHVTQLLMRDNAIQSDGCIYIGKLLRENYNIVEVDLSQNAIGSIGGHVMAKVLRENNALRGLSLAQNSLKDKDAPVLAEALKGNSTLRSLDLSRNKFGENAGLVFGEC